MKLNHSVLSGLDGGNLWRILQYVRWCIPKHNTCNDSLALTLYISSSYSKKTVMADCCFSLRLLFMLIGQSHKWVGLFPYDDMYIGRNLESLVLISVRISSQDLDRIIVLRLLSLELLMICFYHLIVVVSLY